MFVTDNGQGDNEQLSSTCSTVPCGSVASAAQNDGNASSFDSAKKPTHQVSSSCCDIVSSCVL